LARSSRAPISFAAATATARQVAAIEDRIADTLPVAAIRPSPRNPRQRVSAVAELADSLREHGLLQPVVVRPRGAAYELIAGHRRLEAAKMLGWTEIAAVVRDETDDQAYILTLVENLQREDLTPKEEAAALEVLVRERSWSTRQLEVLTRLVQP
jgi:ParB/RepB/Spo0J family partition protein